MHNSKDTSECCWYCNKDDGEMKFCWEFDTFVHVACVQQAAKNKDDREAQIIADEILGRSL
jgi:hypothetical protein